MKLFLLCITGRKKSYPDGGGNDDDIFLFTNTQAKFFLLAWDFVVL